MSSSIRKLTPFLDDEGYLREVVEPGEAHSIITEHPVILPPKQNITRLMILVNHRALFNLSTEWLLSFLKATYWIPKGRKSIEEVT